jgi:menaquinone-specific isochorismate synthase
MLTEMNTMYESLQSHYGRLISVALPCPGITLNDFLRHSRDQPRYYWESSRDNVAFAGTGTALEIVAWGAERFQTVQHHAAELFAESLMLNEAPVLAAPRLFGGFSFRDDFVPDYAWSDFTPAHFVLPHYQLTRLGDETWLTINAHIPFGENPHEMLEDLRAALEAKIAALQENTRIMESPKPEIVDVHYPMPYETWAQHIQNATARMKRGELRKVVLSRVCEIRLSQHLYADEPLNYLAQSYPGTYRFLFEPRPHHAFFGATPELLTEVQGSQVKTMALAGSIGRGASPAEDEAMINALLNSAKDRYEHQLVVDGIRARLQPMTTSLNIEPTSVMTLTNIHHLYAPVNGTLSHADGVIPVLEALHPTPALGGDPRDLAMQLIGEAEPVPRGWYAAPVGWIDRDLNGQFAVAIRSAVMQEKRVWLYAGAGIVADSDPQKEWDETALKFQPMLNALKV